METRSIVILIGLVVCQTFADFQENVWQEPNAWERHSPSVNPPNTCPVCEVVDDGALAVFYYKKLIGNLFNKKSLKEDEYTGRLERAILFSISPDQMEIIEKSTDIRDLDAVITAILAKARAQKGSPGSGNGESFLWLIIDIFRDCLKILQITLSSSEARFGLFVLVVLMLIWFVHKRYNKNLIAIIAVGFILFGYFYTYLECNRKLDADKLVAFVRETEPEKKGWFKRIFSALFFETETNKEILKIQKQSKIDFPFCRPDHVLLMYINELFLNQLQLIITKCVEFSMSTMHIIPFPYNLIAVVALPFVLKIILIPLVFKYICNPVIWYKIIRGDNSAEQLPQVAQHEDRISGANLRILLQAIASDRSPNPENLAAPSGVQEIIESIEPVAICGTPSNKSDDANSESDNSHKNISINEEDKSKKEN